MARPQIRGGYRTSYERTNGLARKLKKKYKKHMEANENENTTVQDFWDAAKAVLRGKFVVI